MLRVKYIVIASLLAFGCGEAEVVDTTSGDRGVVNAKEVATKADQWNFANNPERFQVELNYKLEELPKSGRSEHIPWPADYWPTYKDSINKRWKNAETLSPAEKYDAAFHGWDPESVSGLRPMNPSNCDPESWDDAYYEKLGPVATYVSNNNGNKKTRKASRDGLLNNSCNAKTDGQCLKDCDELPEDDAQAITYCKKRCNRGGVETWWGLCHAWVPAAMLEKEPLKAVEHNGVTFEVSDIKALLIEKYNRSQAYMIGGRCNDREVKRDEETGRVLDDECRDTNAGAWHVVMANFLGIMKRTVAEDRTYNYEVWNQPIIEWEVSEMKEIDMARAKELLKFEGDVYPYNDNAKKLFEVKAASHYVTESSPSTEPFTDTISTYTRVDKYHYILEVDADGLINGGEWVGSSNTNHPDFLWLPTSGGGGVPDVDLSTVRMLLEKSRQTETPTTPDAPETDLLVLENSSEFEVPDNAASGVSSTIDVHEAFTTGKIEVEVNIEHSYIGDLDVVLRKDGKTSTLHGRAGGSASNITKTFVVTDMGGLEAQGTWELVISDHAAQDVGTLKNWKLKLHKGGTTTPEAENTLVAESTASVAIADNDPAGSASRIEVAESHTIKRMKVTVNIKHTYVGALVVELKHGAIKKTLHNLEGGEGTSIVKTYTLEEFNGDLTAGSWELKVVDSDAYDDSGSIENWNIEFAY